MTVFDPTVTDRMTFGSLEICFDDTVLRPRPWTIEQSQWAADLMPDLPPGAVLEVCAGVGHIGLAAVSASERSLVMADASEHACRWARENVERARVDDRAEVRRATISDLADGGDRFALVIADPPWVPTQDVGRFPTDPRWAIDGGVDGLGVAHECLELASQVLVPGGAALLQLGTSEQAVHVAARLRAGGSRLHVMEVRSHEPDGVLVLLA